jgi:hypothetical protein
MQQSDNIEQLSLAAQKEIQLRVAEGCRRVHCQRLLVQGPGSQYFEVQPPADNNDPGIVPVNGQGVGESRETSDQHYPGGRARRGQPVHGAHAVAAVPTVT